jgi:hypothetical protein
MVCCALLSFDLIAPFGLHQTLLSAEDGDRFKVLLALKLKCQAYRRHVAIQMLRP